MNTSELMQKYRIVVRPSLLGNYKFCAAKLRNVGMSGDKIGVWPQTHTEADTLDEVVAKCAEKCIVFEQSSEYKHLIY